PTARADEAILLEERPLAEERADRREQRAGAADQTGADEQQRDARADQAPAEQVVPHAEREEVLHARGCTCRAVPAASPAANQLQPSSTSARAVSRATLAARARICNGRRATGPSLGAGLRATSRHVRTAASRFRRAGGQRLHAAPAGRERRADRGLPD